MATFLLLPGAGSTSWYWHLVVPELEQRGHRAIAVDLPSADDSAGLQEYADAAVAAVPPDHDDDLIVVAQSMAGFTAPLLCDRLPVRLIVLLAAMVPSPHEAPGDWWANTGWSDLGHISDDDMPEAFLHDVPPDTAAASANHVTQQSGTPFEKPWPLDAWPDVPTRFLLARHDRFFPADFQRRVVKERLGITPDEMDGGHLPALSRPVELAQRLDDYAAGL